MVKHTKRRGFTLIEVVTTIFIIALLILLVLPNVNNVRKFAEQKQQTALVQTIQTQVDLYLSENPDKVANFGDLQTNQYLSADQVKQAKAAGIDIKDSQVFRAK